MAHVGYGQLARSLRQLVQAAAVDQAAVKDLGMSASLGGGIGFVDRAVEEDQAATTLGLDP